MADQSQRLGIVVYVEDQATGKLAKVKAEVAGLGPTGSRAAAGVKSAAAGVSSIEKAASRAGTALSHARSQIGGLLTGPLGFLGIGAGLLTLGGAFASGLSKAQDWGLQIEKLQGITHNSAESLSGLLAVTEKYGLSDERLAQIAGFTEKALGNLEKGVTGTGLALAGVRGPTDAVVKAQEQLRVATLRLHEVEGRRKASLSSIVTAQNHVADAQRALTKAMAGGGAAVGGADKFLKDYGFDIRDSAGHVKDFSTLLLTFSDYWNGNTAQGLKAAAAAKLFGRGYADLVPILNLGSKGIQAAEEEAKALGLTLTQDNVVALAKAREATRQWGDALGGLELQLGLTLLPILTDVSVAATKFVSDNRGQIVAFFRDGAHFAQQLGGAIHDDVLPVFGAIAAAWNGIPDPLKQLLIGGFVAQKAVKWAFGIDIAKPFTDAIGSTIKGALRAGVGEAVAKGMISAGIGKAFVQPVFVTNPGFGGGGGIPGGAAGAAEGAAGGGLLTTVLAAASVTAIGAAVTGAMFYGIPALLNAVYPNAGRPGEGSVRDPSTGQDAKVSSILGNIDQGTAAMAHAYGSLGNLLDKAAQDTQAAQHDSRPYVPVNEVGVRQAMSVGDTAGRDSRPYVTAADRTTAAVAALRHPLDALHQDFREQVGVLRHSADPAAIARAAARAAADVLRGVGSAAGSKALLVTLKEDRRAVAATGDKADLAKIDAAIRAVESKIPGREYVDRQLAKADRILHSSETANQKSEQLKAIQRQLLAAGYRTGAQEVSRLDAIARKKTSVSVVTGSTAHVTTYITTTGGSSAAASNRAITNSFISKMSKAGAFAAGGDYPGRRPRYVGEQGPELDVPTGPGTVFTASQTRRLRQMADSGRTTAWGGGMSITSRPDIRLYVTPAPLRRANTVQERYGPSVGSAGSGHHGVESVA